MKTKIGISDKNLDLSAAMLSIVLSSEMALYVKTRKFHWNVSGESFMELHKLFESQYQQLESAIDEVAERINKLGHKTIGTMQEFAKLSILRESPGEYPKPDEMILELLRDHENTAVELRKDVKLCNEQFKDIGTADFLTKLLEQHESLAWTLRKYLE
jgi:starvation-inducible DNA-binding protein